MVGPARHAAVRTRLRALPGARLFGREETLPAFGHAVPDDLALKIPGGARHAAAFVGVLLEFRDDVHLPALARWRMHPNARRARRVPDIRTPAGAAEGPEPAGRRGPGCLNYLKRRIFYSFRHTAPDGHFRNSPSEQLTR